MPITEENARQLRLRYGHGRQYGYEIGDIKKNHVIRYEWAAGFVDGLHVMDAGCGIGYGSKILASRAATVVGLECDREVVQFAIDNWSASNIRFQTCELLTDPLPICIDACIALESIEHLIAPEIFLSQLPIGCRLIGSTPNETPRPLARHRNPHHFQHYTVAQIQELLEICGFPAIDEWKSQDFGDLEDHRNGRTLIFRSTKTQLATVDYVERRQSLVRKLTAAVLDRSNRILELKKRLR